MAVGDMCHDGSARIALGTRDRVVQVLKTDSKGELHSVFSIRLDTTVPITVGFVDNTAKDILIFSLYDGKM